MSYCIKKPKSLKLINIKKISKNFKNGQFTFFIFLPNNVLTRLFKELKKERKKKAYKKERKKRMTINNIEIIYVRIIVCILMYIF